MTLTWKILIDWDEDETLESDEGALMVDLLVERGRDNYLRQGDDRQIVGFERVSVGRAEVVLLNTEGRFDPYNTGSALYPNIAPGKLARIQVVDNDTSTTYDVIAGRIKNILPITKKGINTVRISLEDGLRELYSSTVYIAIQETIDIDTALGLVLTDADYFWGWADNESHAGACMKLADTDLGQFFIAADGKATFKGRNTINPIVLTLTQADILKEIPQPQPWETLRDAVLVKVYPRILRSTADLWTLQDVPFIPANTSKTYWSSFTYEGRSVPAKTLIDPAITTDFLMNSQSDGGGSNLSANFTVVMTGFSKSSKLVVTNTSTSAGAYVTLLKQRGDAVDSPDITGIQAGTGKRIFVLDTEWMQQVASAEAYAGSILDMLSSTLQFPTVQLEARPDIQFQLDLFGAIHATIDKLSLDNDFSIGRITHQWLNQNGQAVLTRWRLEPFSGFGGGWMFPVELGITSEFVL